MPRRAGYAAALAVLVAVAGCGASSATLVNAAVNTAVGAAVSAARRSSGKCYTWCDEESRCNPDTGLCERMPCGGHCSLGRHCESTPTGEHCMPDAVVPADEGPRATPAAASQTAPLAPSQPAKPAWLP